MVFGLSYGDVVLLMVGTVVLLGPKDLPIIARAAGRLTGRAVGYMQTMRGQVNTIMQQSQTNNLQKELRETMAQFDAIRHELRSGVSIMQPRTIVRETFENHGAGLQQATKIVTRIENTLDRFVQSTGPTSNAQSESLSKSSVDLQRQATSYARFAGPLSVIERTEAAQRVAQIGAQQTQSPEKTGKEIQVLPISAVSMGLFVQKTGPIAGGSDLMLECLAERKVAQQAIEFLEQPNEKAVESLEQANGQSSSSN